MSNNTVQPAIVVFDKDRTEVLGIAPEGTTDITYLSTISAAQANAGATQGLAVTAGGEMVGRDGVAMGKPVTAVVNLQTGGIEYAGRVFIPADPDTGVLDQTTLVQKVLDGCLPGQTAVLPPPTDEDNRYVKCGTITIPSGVRLESAGSSPIGWTVKFSPSISQAFNSRIGSIWFKQSKFDISRDPETGTSSGGNVGVVFNSSSKSWTVNQWKNWFVKIDSGTGSGQSKRIISNDATTLTLSSAFTTTPDATSVYSINCNISTIVFDGTQVDGTDTTHSNSTAGDAFAIGNLAFDIKILNGMQIWNYGGFGIAVYGNSDRVNNTGTVSLASGVFITGDHLKIFNCGGAGAGGGILLKGAPQDGGSLHIGTILLDHCQYGMYIDPCVNGDPNTIPAGSGGWTVSIDSMRLELCGKIGAGTETPAIVNVRGHVGIGFLWYSSAVTTNFYKNIWHRNGSFTVREGRMVKGGAQAYGIYCDSTKVAKCNWVANYNYDIGLQKFMTTADTSASGAIASFRFQIIKTAGGLTVQHITTTGGGFGTGHGAGDQYSSTVSADITNGGATVSVGAGFNQLYYQLSAGGGLLRVQPAFRTVNKVVMSNLLVQTANIAGLTVDTKTINGTTDFTLAFRNATGGEVNLNSTMTVGQTIDAQVIIALNDV